MRINLRYLPKSLTQKDKKKQSKELIKSRKFYKKGKYYTRKIISSFKSKKSHYITDAKKIYNVDKIGPTNELSKATGCSKMALNKIVKKGKPPHPGFENAVGTGIGLRFIPGTDASDFQERFREVTSGAFLEAFESLRGGGSITEKEGEKATAAKTRMSLAQSETEFVTAAREYQEIIRVGIGRAQERLRAARGANASAGNTGTGATGKWGAAVAE